MEGKRGDDEDGKVEVGGIGYRRNKGSRRNRKQKKNKGRTWRGEVKEGGKLKGS